MRVTGLMSNLDWEALVEQLMAVESRPLDALRARVDALQALQSTWTGIDGLVASLRSAIEPILSTDFMKQYAVTSSHEAHVTATAAADAIPGTYDIIVNTLAQAHAVASDPDPDQIGVSGSFTLSGDGGTTSVMITVDTTDTLASLAQKINDAYEAQKAANPDFVGVRATVINNQLVLTRSETGAQQIVVSDGGSNLLESLGITAAGTGDATFKNVLRSAQQADVTINGIRVLSDSNTIAAVQGLTIELHKQDPATTVTLTVALDRAAVEADLKAFVSAYNALIEKVAGLTGKDQQLQGDATARSLLHGTRYELFDRYDVAGVLRSVVEIGLDTAGTEGTVSLDADKFWEQFDAAPDRVEELLRDALGALDAYLNTYSEANGILDGKLVSLADQEASLEASIERMEARLEARRELLMRQFQAMESMLAQLNAQGNWLAMQLFQLG